jgi:hypothetical protein
MAQIEEAIQRTLERLQTGWQPTADQIPAEVPQHHLETLAFHLVDAKAPRAAAWKFA